MNPLNNNSPFNGPLTPHQFRQQQASPQSASEQTKSQTKAVSVGRYMPLVLGGLALLVLPVTIWQINTQQDIRQQASQEVPAEQRPVAKVGTEFITDEDIDIEYTKQQNATTYLATPSSLRNQILNDLVDKKLILLEAKKRNITVSDQEVDEKLKMVKAIDPDVSVNKELAKDMVYAEKLALAVAPSLTVTLLHSYDSSEASRSFLETIYDQALENENLAETALPYSTQSRDIELYRDIVLTERNYFFTELGNSATFLMEEGEISDIFSDNGKLYIVELIARNEAQFNSFSEFLEKSREENAQISPSN